MFNITISQFINKFVSIHTVVKVIKDYETLFEGTAEELCYNGQYTHNLTLCMVIPSNNELRLYCRD